MRRRSKVKVVWLPTTSFNSASADNRSTWQFASQAMAVTAGSRTAFEIPVVLDGVQSDPLDATSSLADIESSGYRLRRIVGKVYVFIGQTQQASASLVGVNAGFIIRRTQSETGTSLASAFATGGEVGSEINPATTDSSMDPWIWRRSWLLADNGATGTTFASAPGSNFGAQYPGPLEGPHVDQKTARIVGPEERLFLDISTTIILPGDEQSTSMVVITDLRVLGSMRANIGNRRNASR